VGVGVWCCLEGILKRALHRPRDRGEGMAPRDSAFPLPPGAATPRCALFTLSGSQLWGGPVGVSIRGALWLLWVPKTAILSNPTFSMTSMDFMAVTAWLRDIR
jgi:hypothetical protein